MEQNINLNANTDTDTALEHMRAWILDLDDAMSTRVNNLHSKIDERLAELSGRLDSKLEEALRKEALDRFTMVVNGRIVDEKRMEDALKKEREERKADVERVRKEMQTLDEETQTQFGIVRRDIKDVLAKYRRQDEDLLHLSRRLDANSESLRVFNAHLSRKLDDQARKLREHEEELDCQKGRMDALNNTLEEQEQRTEKVELDLINMSAQPSTELNSIEERLRVTSRLVHAQDQKHNCLSERLQALRRMSAWSRMRIWG